jgi:hypothetical protein
MVAAEKKEGEEALVHQYVLQGHTPNDLTSTRP